MRTISSAKKNLRFPFEKQITIVQVGLNYKIAFFFLHSFGVNRRRQCRFERAGFHIRQTQSNHSDFFAPISVEALPELFGTLLTPAPGLAKLKFFSIDEVYSNNSDNPARVVRNLLRKAEILQTFKN